MGMIDLHNIESPHSFLVIFHYGATIASSPSEEDFVRPIVPFKTERRLGGMAGGMYITGVGPIKWIFRAENILLVDHSMCYHVPNSKARFINPQRCFNKL